MRGGGRVPLLRNVAIATNCVVDGPARRIARGDPGTSSCSVLIRTGQRRRRNAGSSAGGGSFDSQARGACSLELKGLSLPCLPAGRIRWRRPLRLNFPDLLVELEQHVCPLNDSSPQVGASSPVARPPPRPSGVQLVAQSFS